MSNSFVKKYIKSREMLRAPQIYERELQGNISNPQAKRRHKEDKRKWVLYADYRFLHGLTYFTAKQPGEQAYRRMGEFLIQGQNPSFDYFIKFMRQQAYFVEGNWQKVKAYKTLDEVYQVIDKELRHIFVARDQYKQRTNDHGSAYRWYGGSYSPRRIRFLSVLSVLKVVPRCSPEDQDRVQETCSYCKYAIPGGYCSNVELLRKMALKKDFNLSLGNYQNIFPVSLSMSRICLLSGTRSLTVDQGLTQIMRETDSDITYSTGAQYRFGILRGLLDNYWESIR